MGIIEEVGKGIRNFSPGDRVVIPSTIGCGNCSYCRAGYFGQCDRANPNGPQAGTAFFGGPKSSGPFELPFVDHLGDVKDAIGEWHDWEVLVGIAKEVLDHGRNCRLVERLQNTVATKYVRPGMPIVKLSSRTG